MVLHSCIWTQLTSYDHLHSTESATLTVKQLASNSKVVVKHAVSATDSPRMF
jgi:hypothetical protein